MSTQQPFSSSFLRRLRPSVTLAAWCGLALAGLLACGGRSADMATDTKTNWLGSCESDSDCSSGLDCLCGICTRECEAEEACNGLAGAECGAMSGCGDVALVCTSSAQNDDAGAPAAADDSAPAETSDDATDGESPAATDPAPTEDDSETDAEGDDTAPMPGPTEPGSEPMPPSEDDDAGAQQCPRPLDDYSLRGDACLLADFACDGYFIDECGCGCEELGDAGAGELCGLPRSEYTALGDACLTARFACAEGTEMFTNECGCGCTEPAADAGARDCDDPARRYVARSPAECAASLFMCEPGTTMFYDTCGCGCLLEADAGAVCESDTRDYKSRDPEQCQLLDFVCEDGETYFGDDCGCGCETQGEVPVDCEPAPGSAVPADVLQLGLDACYYDDAVEAAAGLIESAEELSQLFDACNSPAADIEIDFTQKRLFVAVVSYAPDAQFNYAVEDEGVVHVGVQTESWCLNAQPPASIVAVALDVGDSSVTQDTCQISECEPL